MTAISAGPRGPEFYQHMPPEELAAHQARDNGDLTPEMVEFDKAIDKLAGLSDDDKAALRALATQED